MIWKYFSTSWTEWCFNVNLANVIPLQDQFWRNLCKGSIGLRVEWILKDGPLPSQVSSLSGTLALCLISHFIILLGEKLLEVCDRIHGTQGHKLHDFPNKYGEEFIHHLPRIHIYRLCLSLLVKILHSAHTPSWGFFLVKCAVESTVVFSVVHPFVLRSWTY